MTALLLASYACDVGGGAPADAVADAAIDTSDAAGRAEVRAADGMGPEGGDATVDGTAGCRDPATDGATAECLRPDRPPEHYVAQALAYFDTLDVDADPASAPAYGDLVARWEWPPWLLLTGYGRDNLDETADALRDLDPSTVPVRDCRFFDTQPFARCRVVFEYADGPCPIYEEFVFDDAGRVTFIEAWSDLPGLLPLAPGDPWGERADVPRLSTRVPGLGRPGGRIDPEGPWMARAASTDADVADFARRARDFWGSWADALLAAPDDFFARGCGW